MIGTRYDRQDVDFVEQTSDAESDQTTTAFLPQSGIVFRLTESISTYASYTESFSPNSVERRDVNGNSFDPEEGTQIEVGLKASILNERLNLTFAAFDIEKSNITERNLDGDFDLLGALESSGAEFELQALINKDWQFRMGYAYVDSIVSESPTESLIGARNAFAPEHDAFIWTRYNLPKTIFGGVLGLSLGMNYESTRVTNASTTTQVELPSHTRIDFGAYYDINDYRIAFNIENAFDETYFTGGTQDTKLYPGDPRLVTLSLKRNF